MSKKLTGRSTAGEKARNLNELKRGEHGILERIDLPEEDARRLMEMGVFAGAHDHAGTCLAPGGDPRVFRVDGSGSSAAARDRA